MKTNIIDLSIVIVSYNTKDFLRECLESIKVISNDLNVEIFVVDNASVDGSPSLVRDHFSWITLTCNTDNLGFAAGNNQAIAKCRGKYVMLLNSDTLLLKGSIEKIISFMNAHPEAGAVGCKLLNTDGSLQPSVTSFPNLLKDVVGIALKGTILKNTPETRARLSRLTSIFGINLSRFDDHSEIKEIDFPRGACFTACREMIDQVGMLDEDYFFTGEEMDWCYRMKQLGWHVYYYPDAAVIHHDHGASKNFMGKVFIQTRKSALRFYEKHYGRTKTEMMKALVSTVLLLKCMSITVRLLFSSSNRKALLVQRETYWATIRIYYDRGFRRLNVFSEMPFRYL